MWWSVCVCVLHICMHALYTCLVYATVYVGTHAVARRGIWVLCSIFLCLIYLSLPYLLEEGKHLLLKVELGCRSASSSNPPVSAFHLGSEVTWPLLADCDCSGDLNQSLPISPYPNPRCLCSGNLGRKQTLSFVRLTNGHLFLDSSSWRILHWELTDFE